MSRRASRELLDCAVEVKLILDMDMDDIEGFEPTFKEAVAQDVADAVGGRRDEVSVLALEGGSIVVRLRLERGVCGELHGAMDAALNLERQVAESRSPLKRGRFTSKTKDVIIIWEGGSSNAADEVSDSHSLNSNAAQDQMAAAVKIQAIARGGSDRCKVKARKTEAEARRTEVEAQRAVQERAAVKIQAIARGGSDRDRMKARRTEVEAQMVAKGGNDWNGHEGTAPHGRAKSGAAQRQLSRDNGAADHAVLQQVVKQLESNNPEHAKSAAAALEYLVSSSDPQREGGREGLVSLVQWRWSAEGAKANRRALGQYPGLWKNLLGLLMGSCPNTQAQVCGAMSKLGFRNTSNVLEMIKYPEMLMALTQLLDMDKNEIRVVVQAWRVLQNFVSGVEEIKVVLCSAEHLLMSIKEACTRRGVPAEVRRRAVSVVMHASSSEEARDLLVKAQVAEEALQVVMSADIETEKDEATRIRATLASANLCGREERSFLSTAPEMLCAIVETIRHAFHGTEYRNIKWSLAGVMLPLFNLSCSDSNKKVLSQEGTVTVLLQAVSQGAKVKWGGCGSRHHDNAGKVEDQEDWSIETMKLVLQTIANFTFDADAKEQMLREDALVIFEDVLACFKMQQESLGQSGVDTQWTSAIKICKDILFMLSEKNEDMMEESRVFASTDDIGMTEDEDRSDNKSRHVMISYSWQQGKDFVVEVSAGLRDRGFDVWRDEDGSNLVRKMMGSSMDVMAKAIEVADVVIIFVSRAYRDSYNCKLEGRYAQVRERANLVKILFVMMEEDYTPESNCGVDGWLGMLIGDHIYYPGWDTDKLDETVAELAKAIHNARNETSSASQPELSHGMNDVAKAQERPPLGGSGSIAALALASRRRTPGDSLDDGAFPTRRETVKPRKPALPRREWSFPGVDDQGSDALGTSSEEETMMRRHSDLVGRTALWACVCSCLFIGRSECVCVRVFVCVCMSKDRAVSSTIGRLR